MDSSFAAEFVDSNHDLLIQILKVLPVTSLLRFKSVSNAWLLLITHYVGARRNVSGTSDPSLGIFLRVKVVKNEESVEEYRHEFVPLNPNHRFANKSPVLHDFFTCPRPILGNMILSSNGLLLFYDFASHRYNVYNPTTLSYTTIPNPAMADGGKWTSVGVTMAFDRVTSHYKLIFVSPIQIGHVYKRYQIEIYSSETHTRSASCIIKDVDGGWSEMLRNGVYWNGSVHWILTFGNRGNGKILIFHIDTLAVHEVTEPAMSTRYKYEVWSNRYFGESCGHLYYIEQENNDLMMIYEMKTDYSDWLPKYRINLAKFGGRWCINVLSLIRFEDEKESPVLLLCVGKKVVKCNLADRKFKTLREFPTDYLLGLQRMQKYVVSKEFGYRENRVPVSPSFYTLPAFPFIPSLSGT